MGHPLQDVTSRFSPLVLFMNYCTNPMVSCEVAINFNFERIQV